MKEDFPMQANSNNSNNPTTIVETKQKKIEIEQNQIFVNDFINNY